MAVQIFRAERELYEVGALILDQKVWLKAREVAQCLRYVDAPQAIRKHVDKEDKKTYATLVEGVVDSTTSSNQQPHEEGGRKGLQALGHLRSASEHPPHWKLRRCDTDGAPGADRGHL
eukprot:9486340-Alexandrium_andersonii.AAC.1